MLVFGATPRLRSAELLDDIRAAYPEAVIVGCSTAGEIEDVAVHDDSLAVTAVAFDHTHVRGSQLPCPDRAASRQVGRMLGELLLADDLAHVLLFSAGLQVNGSDLVRGLSSVLPDGVAVTGGLAGDGQRFEDTCAFIGEPQEDQTVAAIGLYGRKLRVGYASLGGWDPFGPERLITRSEGNVLHELDGRSALGLYKRYLGEYAAELPASALLFPLSLRTPDGGRGIVRTILSIDDDAETMTFAGDVPEGSYARFMKANFERLIDGATDAARTSATAVGSERAELALLISCVGRRMVLKQRVEEEIESVREVLGPEPVLTGFYSYGEISPFTPNARCELHNQTMTITTLAETDGA
ncbi:MAG: FIST N-terminal domain-containing protein [Planctomycetota bacterium]|nr:FIST N-terminal domain-containing protein [Planctomycetota bacterium]